MEEVFKSGSLVMSSSPVTDLAQAVRWGELPSNRILAVAAVLLLVLALPDLLRLAEIGGVPLRAYALVNTGDGIVPHGDPAVLYEKLGLDADSLAEIARRMLRPEGSES